PEWYMDIPARVAFAGAANGYLEHSTLLFSTDQDWLEEAIASSETGMFVMGSEENPYRQYENYKAYCYEERPTEMIPTEQELRDMLVAACEEDQIPYTLNGVDVINGPMSEEEWHDAWQQHLDSYQVGSAAPQITDKSASWYADLDHDGVDERIVFDWYFLDNATPGTFAVLESNGKVVYMNDWLGTPHAGWGTYYVCQRESKEYLLWYCPNVSTGSGNYNYELLELTSSGEMQRVEAGDTYFRADPGQYVVEAYPDYKMNIADMAEFAERINALLDTSYLLVSTDQDWMNQELNQTMNGFVLGDADDPHRQYENYRVLTDKLLTKVRPQQGAIYKLLKNWCEAEGMPYIDVESSRIWEADLTHNGQPEQLVFDWSQFDTGGTGTLSVRDDWGQEIYSVEISSDHGFSSTYYLCQWQGKDYLFYYKPYIMMGEGYNSYELFYLTAAGEKILEDADSIGFYVDFIPSIVNEYGKRVMDIPAMVSFAETVNRYVAFSYLLVCSDSEWLPMPYSEGRYFVAGSPEEPYRVSETYACFDGDEKALGQDFSGITDVAQKLKAWCESAKMPYVE
ncbi:MAG: hypothetical protein J6I64_01795, partial [Lachnospiraceae bacterium]|nr:hypothetical protein [Lachnospiraceae bacterium]